MMPAKKIRVVFGINDFLVGGAQRLLTQLVEQMDSKEFDIHIIVLFTFDKPTLLAEIPQGIGVHELSFSGFKDLASWRKLYRLLRELQPDVVISNLFFSNTVFRILSLIIGYRSIAVEHNTYIDKPLWQRMIDKVLALFTARIVAVSTSVATFTAKQEGIPIKKFRVIMNGIDMSDARARLKALPGKVAIKEQFGFKPTDRIALTVSRLTLQKNHSLLLRSFALFKESHPEWVLVIVGGGSRFDELVHETQALGLAESVRFFGNQSDVWSFYKMADISVSTSFIEGFSIAYLEALAAGIPIAATKTAGTDEILKEGMNGFFIASMTPKAAVVAMEACLVLVDSARDGIRTDAERFDIRQTARQYEALIRDVLA